MLVLFSSPFGDFVFYMFIKIKPTEVEWTRFSSPFGDFVFYMFIKIKPTEVEWTRFSSPLGDFVFYMNLGENIKKKQKKGFRPRFGISFFIFI